MASYTILTTRKQEIGLGYDYDTYADKTTYPTRESWLQYRVSTMVTNPMYDNQQRSQAVAFDQSFQTIPELNQPKAQTEIEQVIITNGGTIVTPTPPGPIPGPPTTSGAGGAIPTPGGEGRSNLQTPTAGPSFTESSGRDGEGDNEAS